MMVYSYGTLGQLSYAMAAGTDYYNYTVVDTIPPDPGYTPCCCSSHNYTVIDKPDDKSIRSNLGSIYLDTDKSYNFQLSYTNFVPGVDSSADWRISAVDEKKDAYAMITFTDRAGNESIVEIYYNPTVPTIKPEKIYFPNVSIGTAQDQIIKLFNKGSLGDYIWALGFKNPESEKSLKFIYRNGSPIQYPLTIAANDSIEVKLVFNPSNVGEINDSIKVILGTNEIDTCYIAMRSLVSASTGPLSVGDESAKGGIIIEPIPATDFIYLNKGLHALAQGEEIVIYNSMGMDVLRIRGTNRQMKIDVSSLPPGVYFVKIGNKVCKFVKI